MFKSWRQNLSIMQRWYRGWSAFFTPVSIPTKKAESSQIKIENRRLNDNVFDLMVSWQEPSWWILPIIWDLLISSGVMSIFRCCLQISTILSSQLKSNANKIYITEDLTKYRQQLVSKIQIARKERRIDSFWTKK
jgi:hypothetical protein